MQTAIKNGIVYPLLHPFLIDIIQTTILSNLYSSHFRYYGCFL